jgi:hypothetical protein
MTLGQVVAPAGLSRRRLALLVPAVVGLLVGIAFWRAERPRPRAAGSPPLYTCREPVATPSPPEPPPSPRATMWPALERCLAEQADTGAGRPRVTVADVRRWVEVEHDPMWLEGNVWWVPMSGEGEAQMPSGYYVGVPMDDSPCRGAIMN